MAPDNTTPPEQRHWRIVAVFALAAFLWGIALVIAAATLPFGAAVECTGGSDRTPTCRNVARTPLESEGPSALLIAAIPAVITASAALALLRARRRPAGRGLQVAGACAGLLAVLTLVGIASVGMLIAPAAAALLIAVTLTWTTSRPSPDHDS
jgi:hypothetical protein